MLTQETSELKDKRLVGLVQHRNRYVSDEFKIEKAKTMSEDVIPPEFPISNTHYMMHLTGAKSADGRLSREMTGIDALRDHLLGLVAPARLRSMKHHVNIAVAVLTKGIELWALGICVKTPQQLCNIVARPLEKIQPRLEEYLKRIERNANETIVEPMNQLLPSLVNEARPFFIRWKKLHWATLRKFMQNYGRSDASLTPEHDWNRDIFQPAVDQIIMVKWGLILRNQSDVFVGIGNDLEGWVNEIAFDIGNEPDAQSLPFSKLCEFLRDVNAGIQAKVKERKAEFESDLENIKLAATTSDYFASAMRDTFERNQPDRGKDYVKRVVGRLEQKVTEPDEGSPFMIAGRGTVADINTAAQSATTGLHDDLMIIFNGMLTTFRRMIVNKSDPHEAEVGEALREHFEKRGQITGQLKARLEKVIHQPQYGKTADTDE